MTSTQPETPGIPQGQQQHQQHPHTPVPSTGIPQPHSPTPSYIQQQHPTAGTTLAADVNPKQPHTAPSSPIATKQTVILGAGASVVSSNNDTPLVSDRTLGSASLGSSHDYNANTRLAVEQKVHSRSNSHPPANNSSNNNPNPFDQLLVPPLPNLSANQSGAVATATVTSTQSGVELGVEQLERQQLQRDMKVSIASAALAVSPRPSQVKADDALSNENPFDVYSVANQQQQQQSKVVETNSKNVEVIEKPASRSSSFLSLAKIFTPIKPEGNEKEGRDDDDGDMGEYRKDSLISGYLYKQTRQGNWQRRFFETNGKCLMYYKSRKKTKKLAELNLSKVGSIEIDATEPTGSTFIIQVKNRPYFLRADNKEYAEDWVIQLNRVREARFQIGGMSVANEVELLLVANRERSHGVRGEADATRIFETVDMSPVYDGLTTPHHVSGSGPIRVEYKIRSSQVGADICEESEIYNDWKKKGGRMRLLRYKLLLWARKVTFNNICFTDKNEVIEPSTSQDPRRPSPPGYASDADNTSAAASDLTATSQSHREAEDSAQLDPATNRSGPFRKLVNASKSPMRTEVEFVGHDNERDTPTPTFHMA